MLCSVAVSGVMLPTVPDLHGKDKIKKAWKEVARHPPLSVGPAGLAGAAQEEHLLLLQNATAAGPQLDICTCWFVSGYIWSQNVCRLDDSLLPRSLWRAGRGGAGRGGPALLFLSSSLAAARVEAWLEGLLLRLALAGPAGDTSSAPSQECSALSPKFDPGRDLQRGCTVESLEDPSGSSPFEDDMVLHSDGRDAISAMLLTVIVGRAYLKGLGLFVKMQMSYMCAVNLAHGRPVATDGITLHGSQAPTVGCNP